MEQRDLQYVSSLHGGFWNFDIKDFRYMTNPYFPPDEFMENLQSRLKELVKSYPSTNWRISSLVAEPLGLSHEHVVIANGGSELISAISSLFVENLAVPVPTFDEFPNRVVNQGKRVSLYQLDGDFDLDAGGFIQHALDNQANSALFIRPNNPTGNHLSKQTLRNLLESLRHLDVIIVDESFIDFVSQEESPSAVDMLFEFPNMIILKSLSKVYGIPGLRLGYAASGDRKMIAALRDAIPIWSINSLSQFFLEEVGAYQQQFAQSCEDVKRATALLSRGLQSVPYLYSYPTHGNFVLCRILYGFTAAELTARLFDDFGVLINDCTTKRGLDDRFVRVASRTMEENSELLKAFQRLAPASSTLERVSR